MADSKDKKIEFRETQSSREDQLINLIMKICPEVILHSRKGDGLFGSCPRLRFDRKIKLKWFLEMFSQIEPLGFVISKTNNSALKLSEGWADIEIKVHDFLFLEKAGNIALEYRKLSGKEAMIIFEPIKTKPIWRPLFNWLLAIFAIVVLLLGSRLLSVSILKRAIQDLVRFMTTTFV